MLPSLPRYALKKVCDVANSGGGLASVPYSTPLL